MNPDREDYIERITKWLMPEKTDPELAARARARECTNLKDVYSGKSQRIQRMIHLAYLRGVRRGASVAWEARQPVTLRRGVK